MKPNRTKFQLILLVSMTVILSNCSTALSRNLDEPDFAKIEKIHTKYFRISFVKVQDLDSNVAIQGKIEHHSVFGQRAKGHIDISMIAPGGEVLDDVSIRSSGWRLKHRHRRRVTRDASFNVILDTPPMMGSTIRMGFHKSSDSVDDGSLESGNKESFDCGTNIAIPSQ